VWGEANDMWVSARRIWNQHAYHVTNVLESGAIPTREAESFSSYGGRTYNTYRSNPRATGVAPDLVPDAIQISSPDATCGELSGLLDVTVRIVNQGDQRVGPGVVISFAGEWQSEQLSEPLYADAAKTPLSVTLDASLEPGDSIRVTGSTSSAFMTAGVLPDVVRVTVDDGDVERECNELNNQLTAAVDGGALVPDLRVQVGVVSAACPGVSVPTTIYNVGSAAASDVLVRYYAGDPEQGGATLHDVTVPGPVDPGSSVALTAAVPSIPKNAPVRIYAVVNPESSVPECNEGNNGSAAGNTSVCVKPPE
jgi:hypothetical protein